MKLRKQAGFGLLGYAVAALAIVLMLGAAYLAGRADGRKLEGAAWQKREAEINAETATKIQVANEAVRAEEHAKAAKFVEISTGLQGKLKEKDHALNIALDSVRSGAIRLSVPATCPPPGGNTEGGTTASAGGRDATTRAELSEQAARFLTSEASRADKIVEQLTACQAIVRADRR